MKKGFKFDTCRNGHSYKEYGYTRKSGRHKGTQRCRICVKFNNFRNHPLKSSV